MVQPSASGQSALVASSAVAPVVTAAPGNDKAATAADRPAAAAKGAGDGAGAARGSPADAAVNGAVRPSIVPASLRADKGKGKAGASGQARDGRGELGQGSSAAAAGTTGARPTSKAPTSAATSGRARLEAVAGELRQAHAAMIAEHSKMVSEEVALQCGERDMEVREPLEWPASTEARWLGVCEMC
jgi:hypothetical protein